MSGQDGTGEAGEEVDVGFDELPQHAPVNEDEDPDVDYGADETDLLDADDLDDEDA